jgi:RNA polymerase sigma factor (sigma-70 family)
MDDRDIVAAIVAGDADGIGYAYDKYAASLYGYCHWMAPEPADAAVAVQDTFIIAVARLGGLRDPRKLRPWLYAVARAECRRWPPRSIRAAEGRAAGGRAGEGRAAGGRAGEGRAAGGRAGEGRAAGGPAAEGRAAGRDEPSELARAALRGMDPVEREVAGLYLGHHLAGRDLAAMLGVSRRRAHALVLRARRRLEKALGAPMAGRRMSGELSQAVRSALAEPARPPRALRDEVLRLCVEATPDTLAYREWVTRRAGQFGPVGFPRTGGRSRRMVAVTGAVAAASILVAAASAGIVAVIASGGPHPPRSLDAARTSGGPLTAGSGATRTVNRGPVAGRGVAAPAGAPAGAAPGGGQGRPAGGAASRSSPPAVPLPPQATALPAPSGSAQPTASASASPSASPTPPGPASATPSPGLSWPPPTPPATVMP